MSLSSYLVTCLTENLRVVSDYRETPPTTCPNDTGHTIDPLQTTIYDTTVTRQVIIKNDTSNVQGYYKCITYDIGITGATGAGSYNFYSPPYQLQLMTTNIMVCDENIGDSVTINEFPDALVGTLTAPAIIGATGFAVTPSSMQYIGLGFLVKVGGYDVGMCIAKDVPVLNSILTNTPLSTAVSAGSPVRITKVRVENMRLCNKGTISLGRTVSNVFVAPANTLIRVDYNNANGVVKNLQLYFEIFYQLNVTLQIDN